MKAYKLSILFVTLIAISACGDDDMMNNQEDLPDTSPPLVENLRWIDNPSYMNAPAGPIENNGNYTIPISEGFQMAFKLTDDSKIVKQRIYFSVNDNPDIVEEFLSESIELSPPTNYFFNYSHRVDNIPHFRDLFYKLKAGDTYQFYMTFTDEAGNTTNVNWTADLVE